MEKERTDAELKEQEAAIVTGAMQDEAFVAHRRSTKNTGQPTTRWLQ